MPGAQHCGQLSPEKVWFMGQHGFTHVVSALGERTSMLVPFEGHSFRHEVEIFEGVTPFLRLRHGVGYGLIAMVLLSLFFKFLRKNQMAP